MPKNTGLGEIVELQRLVLDIARGTALGRAVRRAGRVPFLERQHLVLGQPLHLSIVERPVLLRALEACRDAVPAPVQLSGLRGITTGARGPTGRGGAAYRECAAGWLMAPSLMNPALARDTVSGRRMWASAILKRVRPLRAELN